jgi:hypothetical protein
VKQTGTRKYEVKEADFPITVVIEARKLKNNNAVASDVLVVQQGAIVEKIPVKLVAVPPLSKKYSIKKPTTPPPSDLTQAITGFFGSNAPDNASYLVTITSAIGDEFVTTIGVPGIDPGIANLTFQYR